MKKRKLLAMLLSFVLMAGCLAGCTKQETSSSPEDAKTETAAPEKAETKKEEANQETKEIQTVTIGLPQNSNVEDYETNHFTKYIEEKVGVNLDFVLFSSDAAERQTQLSLMISSGETLPDILWGFGLSDAQMSEYGNDGYLIDLTQYVLNGENFNDALENRIEPEFQERVLQYAYDTTSGAMYGAPTMVYSPNTVPWNVMYNQTWLDAVGKEVPKTVDELYDVLVAFKNTDINGNGQADEIPAVGHFNGYRADIVEWILNAYALCNKQYLYNATDGQIWWPYNTEEYREGLKFVKKLVDEELLYAGTFTMTTNEELMALFTPTDQVAVAGCVVGQPDLITEADNMMIAQYVGGGPLAGETELGGFQATMGILPSYNTHITADCKNPDLAWDVLDEMYTEEAAVIMRRGIEGKSWKWVDEGSTITGVWGLSRGIPAKMEILDNSQWSSQNNENWHVLSSTLSNYIEYGGTFDPSLGDWATTKSLVFQSTVDAFREFGNIPKENVYKVVYTEEETAVVTEYQQLLKDFVISQTAMFCTGILDPANDADWNTYVSTMDSMGLQELLKTVQTAYTRMNK